MITVINLNTLGVSEYDISNVIDVVNVSGIVYYITPSGIYHLDEDSSESVTSVWKTGKVFFGDNSPKIYPYVEFSCDSPEAEISIISNINNVGITGIDSTRHTEEIRSHRLPPIKQTYLEMTMVGVGDTEYKVSDIRVISRDTLVKK